jgi:hypothetical protein
VVVAVATELRKETMQRRIYFIAGLALAVMSPLTRAAVLADDRAEAMYHSYDGGGVEVTGPALLVRKSLGSSFSASASYYVDSISGASIDVVTTASPYKEKREETGLGLEYLYQNSLMTLSYTNSEESDYLASSLNFDVTQDYFSGMTTVNLGYSRGEDTVGRNDDPTFSRSIDRWQYRIGLTQILTKKMLFSINYEGISDSGYLNNPYRVARVASTTVPERYPSTRSSHATSFRWITYLEPRSSVRAEYRHFWDTWDINGATTELGYSRYFASRWLGEAYLRYYKQDSASFYSDNFQVEMAYMARDKELSTFTSKAIGVKASYQLAKNPSYFQKITLNVSLERVRFDYDNFTDTRDGQLYSFDAFVEHLYLSLWF